MQDCDVERVLHRNVLHDERGLKLRLEDLLGLGKYRIHEYYFLYLEQEEEPYSRVHAYSDFFRDRLNAVYGDRFVVLVVAKGSIDCIVVREHRIVEVAS
jgi:hypothetical protein